MVHRGWALCQNTYVLQVTAWGEGVGGGGEDVQYRGVCVPQEVHSAQVMCVCVCVCVRVCH